MINADNPQVTRPVEEAPTELEPVDDTVRQVAYAAGTILQQSEEALLETHPGWSAYFHDLYQILDNEFGQ